MSTSSEGRFSSADLARTEHTLLRQLRAQIGQDFGPKDVPIRQTEIGDFVFGKLMREGRLTFTGDLNLKSIRSRRARR